MTHSEVVVDMSARLLGERVEGFFSVFVVELGDFELVHSEFGINVLLALDDVYLVDLDLMF